MPKKRRKKLPPLRLKGSPRRSKKLQPPQRPSGSLKKKRKKSYAPAVLRNSVKSS